MFSGSTILHNDDVAEVLRKATPQGMVLQRGISRSRDEQGV
jgi:hypothetical protein